MPRAAPPRKRHVTPAGPDHQVVHIVTGRSDTPPAFQSLPCGQCPWRVDRTGLFPAEAFRISAQTSHDASMSVFACHVAGVSGDSTCAGFLLSSGAEHNINVRLRMIDGQYDPSHVSSGEHDLYGSYREMAEANGVHPADPVLERCR